MVTVNGQVCGASPVDITGSGQFENSASVSVVVEYGDVEPAVADPISLAATGLPAARAD